MPARRCAHATAVACSPIEPARLNAVDRHAWLAVTISRIPACQITRVDDLPPWRWNG